MKKLGQTPFHLCLLLITLIGCSKREETQDGTNKQPTHLQKVELSEPKAPLEVESIKEEAVQIETLQQAAQHSVIDERSLIIGRVWTSSDGRKLEAELIRRSVDAATVRRNSDKKEFTINLASLSEADRKFVAESDIPIIQVKKFDMTRLNSLKKSIPPLTARSPLESTFPNLIDISTKYKRSIEFLSPTGYARLIEMMRTDVTSDLKRLEPIAATSLRYSPDNYGPYGFNPGSGAWKEVWAVRSAVAWLNGPLTAHISELEKLK